MRTFWNRYVRLLFAGAMVSAGSADLSADDCAEESGRAVIHSGPPMTYRKQRSYFYLPSVGCGDGATPFQQTHPGVLGDPSSTLPVPPMTNGQSQQSIGPAQSDTENGSPGSASGRTEIGNTVDGGDQGGSLPLEGGLTDEMRQASRPSPRATPDATGLFANQTDGFIGDFFGGGAASETMQAPSYGNQFFIDGATGQLVAIDGGGLIAGASNFQAAGGGPLVPGAGGNIGGLTLHQDDGTGTTIPVPNRDFTAIAKIDPVTGVQETGTFVDSNGITQLNAPVYTIANNLTPTLAANATRVNIGSSKYSEGSSPIPRDRIFFNYNYFDNTNLGAGGVNVSRFTPGFEKTFNDGYSSFQVRAPFASTLSNNFILDGATNTSDVIFGDVQLMMKTVLWNDSSNLFSAGLQVTLPTAEDQRFYSSDPLSGASAEFARINTQSVHLMPFIGSFHTDGDRYWMQSMLQLDFDANGNPIYFNAAPFNFPGATAINTPVERAGVWNEATYLYADISVGYQVYKNLAGGPMGLTTVSPMLELHYNRSLTDSDTVVAQNNGVTILEFGQQGVDVEVINLTIGTSWNWRGGENFMIGYVTPIAGGSDKEFDGELRAGFTKYLGRSRQDDITTTRGQLR